MDLTEAINQCSNAIQSCYEVEAAIEYTFPDEARLIHAATTLIEEAQYGLSEQLASPLFAKDADNE